MYPRGSLQGGGKEYEGELASDSPLCGDDGHRQGEGRHKQRENGGPERGVLEGLRGGVGGGFGRGFCRGFSRVV